MSKTIQVRQQNRFNRTAALRNTPEVVRHSEYPCRLNFYLRPPPAEISVEDFERFALDRLQVLKTIENATLRNKKNEDFKREMERVSSEHLRMRPGHTKEAMEDRRKDHISHFILRLAYCRSEDLRSWFLRQECALFRHRFELESRKEKEAFLKTLDINWKVVSQEDKMNMKAELETCAFWTAKAAGGQNVQDFVENETYFEVDFERVPDLISRRSVLLRRGKAYVPMTEQISLVMDEFKARLSKALEATAKALPQMDEDERLKPVLLNVEKQYTGKDYGDNTNITGKVKASEVNALSQHFPLCMNNLHQSLTRDKHLKHGGRMQYGLFLKGIGLSVEEALVFWRKAFSNHTDDKFQKEYTYNIRHNYGLEGRRVNYAPYSCMKIIQSNQPSTGDHHGCPFRHFSSQSLEANLYKNKVAAPQVNEIVRLAKDRHYQLACTRYFEVTHPDMQSGQIGTVEHPNQYFDMSQGKEPEPEAMKTD
ncbi:unnamed protein product [Umbelopsis sp. WA50703]